MASTPLPNIWHLRAVAEASSKACYVCYKPTTAVLITPDNKDFFYICKSHLKDKGFASPLVDEKAEAEKRKKEAMDREIEQIKKEYEEKAKAKKGKKKDKAEDESSSKAAGAGTGAGAAADKELDDKIKAVQQAGTPGPGQSDDGPRIFVLQRCGSTDYEISLSRK
ncbi:hypothetical protein DV738_g2156, partial [Chaetothyriales sp. CBS 135597]